VRGTNGWLPSPSREGAPCPGIQRGAHLPDWNCGIFTAGVAAPRPPVPRSAARCRARAPCHAFPFAARAPKAARRAPHRRRGSKAACDGAPPSQRRTLHSSLQPQLAEEIVHRLDLSLICTCEVLSRDWYARIQLAPPRKAPASHAKPRGGMCLVRASLESLFRSEVLRHNHPWQD